MNLGLWPRANKVFTGDSTEHNHGEGTPSLDHKSLPSAALALHGSMPPAMVLAILDGTFVHETTEVGPFSPFAMLLAKWPQ
jgi:hypothetical protein